MAKDLLEPTMTTNFYSPSNRRINQIALQKHIMLAQDRDNLGRIFGALGFVDGNGVCQAHLHI